MHFVNDDNLCEVHRHQMKNKAIGVDKVSKEEYELNLDNNIQYLEARLKSFLLSR